MNTRAPVHKLRPEIRYFTLSRELAATFYDSVTIHIIMSGCWKVKRSLVAARRKCILIFQQAATDGVLH